jgi:beta-glucosidase
MTLSMADWQVLPGGEAQRDEFRAHMEDRYLAATQGDDFIGVQCYTRHIVGPDGVIEPGPEVRTTLMGYEFYPECTGATVRRAAEVTGLPTYLTENGIGTDNDEDRIEYLGRAIASAHEAIADGIDLRGYFCWSLLDNFEWVFGYKPTFGLVSVDRTTFVRTPKPSAAFFGAIARANALEV